MVHTHAHGVSDLYCLDTSCLSALTSAQAAWQLLCVLNSASLELRLQAASAQQVFDTTQTLLSDAAKPLGINILLQLEPG